MPQCIGESFLLLLNSSVQYRASKFCEASRRALGSSPGTIWGHVPMNILIYVFVEECAYIPLGEIPQSRNYGLYAKLLLIFLKTRFRYVAPAVLKSETNPPASASQTLVLQT